MSTASEQFILIIEIIIFAILFIPTMVAFLTGAPWVPTPITRVKRMLQLANLKQGDRIYDLGCGDGRMVQHAAKEYGADAVGLELSPLMYAWAKLRNIILRSDAKILLRDFRRINYTNAAALVFYLLPDILKIMKSKFEKELKPGSRVISYAFEIEGWQPVHIEPRDEKRKHARIFVYEIPTSIKEKGSVARK